MYQGCIAARNIDASPAYFDFYPQGILTRIVFNKKDYFQQAGIEKIFGICRK